MAVTEARCDCTGSPPWPAMIRLHAGGPNRYYLCGECGAVREDVYSCGAIVDRCWHDRPDGTLPEAVKQEATHILETPDGQQLTLWDK